CPHISAVCGLKSLRPFPYRHHLQEAITYFSNKANLFNSDYDAIDGYPVTPRAWMMGMEYAI
ncbi:MAG: hypothetical protein DRG73_07400, partial [Deltaproteobacteria bacterium]